MSRSFKSRMFIIIALPLPRYNLPVIPKNALIWRGSLPGVYVLNKNNQRELRLVRTGDEVGIDGIAILSGIKPGERIVVGNPGG